MRTGQSFRQATETIVLYGLSFLSLGLIWIYLSSSLDQNVLPSPLAVWNFLRDEFSNGNLMRNVYITGYRVMLSFVVAMLIGTSIGILLGFSPRIDRFFEPWLLILMNMPAMVIIVIAYIWFGLNETSAILSVVFAKLPNVIVIVREGTRNLDRQLTDVAKVFRFSLYQRLVVEVLPQLKPYIASAARNGIAIIWKLILVVEMLGRPDGVGFEIYMNFQLFRIDAIVGYALAFSILMILVEYLIIRPMSRTGRA